MGEYSLSVRELPALFCILLILDAMQDETRPIRLIKTAFPAIQSFVEQAVGER